MTPQDVINVARDVLNDTESVTYTDPELLRYVNDGINEAQRLAPHWFYTVGTLTCTAGETLQVLDLADAAGLVRVVRVVGGDAVYQSDIDTMDRFKPGWHTATADAATQWLPDSMDPRRFYIYPPAPASQQLEVLYIQAQTDLALSGTIDLPLFFRSALADYVVYRAESKDEEHTNSGRAVSHYQSFVSKLKV